MESLFEKLRSLGVKIGRENLEIESVKKFPIENVIKGEWLHDELGGVYKVSKKFESGYRHGRILLESDFSFSKLLALNGISNTDIRLKDILFIDTETTGLSGGTGTMAFLIGLGYFSQKAFTIDQYFLDDPAGELSLMNVINNQINNFKIVVSYNGSSFDIPLLRTRFTMNRLRSPFNQMEHFDLLHLSRRIWKLRLTSLKLKDIENEILEFFREEEEVPGWMVPQIYFDFIHTRDARPLGGVFYHNRMDVLSLALIFDYASGLIINPLIDNAVMKEDIISIARFFEKQGDQERSTELFRSSLANGLPENLSAHFLFKMGCLCRKHKNDEIALELWKYSFERGEYQAAIELSKFYEHQARDFIEARHWALSGLDLLKGNHRTTPLTNQDQVKIINRLNRIEKKIKEEQ